MQVKGVSGEKGGNEEVEERQHEIWKMDNKEVGGSEGVEEMQYEEVEDRGLRKFRH